MVVQVRSHRRHVADHGHAQVLQVLRRTQARQQQQLRRAVGAAGYDDFAPRPGGAAAFARVVFDADRAFVLDQHARRLGAGAHHQVGSLPRRLQIRLRRAPAPLVVAGGLVIAAAFLLRAVEVRIARDAGLHRSLQHRVRQLEPARLVGDVQRPADAVEFVAAAGLVLRLLEVRQHGIPVPAFAAALPPFVVVGVAAAHIDHAVDRAGPAQRLAARQVQPPVGKLRLRCALEFPVHLRVDIGLGKAERDVDPGVAVRRPGFQQQHAMAAGFRQPRGDHAARAAGAGDDEVVGIWLVRHSGFPSRGLAGHLLTVLLLRRSTAPRFRAPAPALQGCHRQMRQTAHALHRHDLRTNPQ